MSPDEFLENAKHFIDTEIRPYATLFEEEEGIPRALIKKMGKAGLLSATFPEEFSGINLPALQYGMLNEEIGKACSSTRALLTVHISLVGETINRWGNSEQKKQYLPQMAAGDKIGAFALTEPETGSDASGIRCSYKKKRDGFVITGEKKWISFSLIADFFIVIATEGKSSSAFLVDSKSKGITLTPMKGLLGNRAAYVGEISFQEVEVPHENLLGKEGGGFPFIVNTALNNGRYSIAWGALGIAQEALNNMVNYSNTRKQFGRKIINFQSIQNIIVDNALNVEAARGMCIKAAGSRQDRKIDAPIESIMAKCFSTKIATRASSDAIQVLGGNGCYNKYPVERLYREAKILEIIEGTKQVFLESISKYLLSKHL